jgi:hypothetical protein
VGHVEKAGSMMGGKREGKAGIRERGREGDCNKRKRT